MNKYEEDIRIKKQFFRDGFSRSTMYRIGALRALEASIINHQEEIISALEKDFGKHKFETYLTEISQALSAIKYMYKNIRRFSSPKIKLGNMSTPFSAGKIYPEPYGVVLIISPWNYPFLLAIEPLVGAIASGNCAVIKPSELSPNTSEVIHKIISECFEECYISVVQGGPEVSQELLNLKFDYIFFTGSTRVGKIIMKKAAENLIPVTLELGGKSPCIVDETANLRMAAKRIAWGKFINAGQTCVAPDYALVHEEAYEAFLELLREETEKLYGSNPLENKDMASIINLNNFERLQKLLYSGKVYFGGNNNFKDLKIEPTVLVNVKEDSVIMQEEIFGPILPVIKYSKYSEIKQIILDKDPPLALYIFSNNKKFIKNIIEQIPYGGGCVNDTIVHLSNDKLPFGGVGASGIGKYKGKASFDTFTNYKSVLFSNKTVDIKLKYPPYTDKNYNFIKKFMK